MNIQDQITEEVIMDTLNELKEELKTLSTSIKLKIKEESEK